MFDVMSVQIETDKMFIYMFKLVISYAYFIRYIDMAFSIAEV